MVRYDKNIRDGVGGRLKTARLKNKLSLSKAEEITRIAKCRISEYENEHRAIDIFTLATFAESYEVSLDYLWYGNGPHLVSVRKKDKEILVLESLETLIYYGVIKNRSGKLIFDSQENGLLMNFINEYKNVMNKNNNCNEIKSLEKTYLEGLKASMNSYSRIKNIEEAKEKILNDNHLIYVFVHEENK